MRYFYLILIMLFTASCAQREKQDSKQHLIKGLAEQYVRLGLTIGQYDPDFVDAYYGPDSLRPAGLAGKTLPKDSLLAAVDRLSKELEKLEGTAPDTVKNRAAWMRSQLRAFARRIRIVSGEQASFDVESKELFGVIAPTYKENHFKLLVASLDSLLPGNGAVSYRFQQLANRFIIPGNKLDTVFKTAIAECRRRTLQHYQLPSQESFFLEYVSNKPWSGYNWYKGNYQSVIQINTDLQIFIDRAIDVGSHESYPGHHVYNMLLEKNLYNDKGITEISLYPLFSPQSLIAEGSANYGIELAFPGDEKVSFAREVLLPLATLDTNGIATYFRALGIRDELNYARNEVARGLMDKTMNEQEAMRWLKEYCLMNDETAAKSISFIRRNGTYVINYNYGKDLVRNYINAGSTGAAKIRQWERFGQLLSNQVIPEALLQEGKQ